MILNFFLVAVCIWCAATLPPVALLWVPIASAAIGLALWAVVGRKHLEATSRLEIALDCTAGIYAILAYNHALPMVTGVFVTYYTIGALTNFVRGVSKLMD